MEYIASGQDFDFDSIDNWNCSEHWVTVPSALIFHPEYVAENQMKSVGPAWTTFWKVVLDSFSRLKSGFRFGVSHEVVLIFVRTRPFVVTPNGMNFIQECITE